MKCMGVEMLEKYGMPAFDGDSGYAQISKHKTTWISNIFCRSNTTIHKAVSSVWLTSMKYESAVWKFISLNT